MDAQSFREARQILGLTLKAFGETFGVSRRTVLYWSSKGPPDHIAALLEAALASKVPRPSSALVADPPAPEFLEEARVKLSPLLDDLIVRATEAGWPERLLMAAIESWVRSKSGGNR